MKKWAKYNVQYSMFKASSPTNNSELFKKEFCDEHCASYIEYWKLKLRQMKKLAIYSTHKALLTAYKTFNNFF
ncbi:MAG: hypothetical protein ABIN36_08720 [Ferruginibacter sp.]